MKKILLLPVLTLLLCNISFAEGSPYKAEKAVKHKVEISSNKCMNWYNTGPMGIRRNSNKASFANGYVKFNKKAKINAYLYLPEAVYCVGDRMIFKKTFGSKPVTLTLIQIN